MGRVFAAPYFTPPRRVQLVVSQGHGWPALFSIVCFPLLSAAIERHWRVKDRQRCDSLLFFVYLFRMAAVDIQIFSLNTVELSG